MGAFLQQNPSIKLQTRKGNDIVNERIFIIDKLAYEKQMTKLSQKYIGIVIRPETITSIYNCHGMTFASRRTGINILDEVILIEDDFCEINIKDILPGDVVVYKSDDGEIVHSGFIIQVDMLNKNILTTFVLSKWGDGSEVIHSLYNCPYPSNIQFYRCKN